MTKINLLTTAIKLLEEVGAENNASADVYQLTKLANISLIKNFDELELYCDQVEADCKKAESAVTDSTTITNRLKSVSSAVESLTDELCDANDTIGKLRNDSLSMAALQRKIAEQAIEIKKLSVYKRKNEVMAKDLADAKKQALRSNRSPAATGGFKSEGQKITQRKLNAANNVIADYAAHYLVSPQFEGQVNHSEQGIIDLYRLNQVTMSVQRNGEEIQEVKVERMIVMNSYNSCKVITRINGVHELGKATIPKGGVIKLDDEMLEFALVRFKENDINKARLSNNKQVSK